MDTESILHFSGVNTHSLVGYVRRKLGDDGLGDLLLQAREDRTVDELMELSTWSSYRQFRRLLEVGSDLLGSPELLSRAGAYVDMSSHHSIEALQGLGSIHSFYRNLPAAQAVVTTIVDVEAEQTAPGEWRIRQRFQHGFEPFRAYCAFARGQLSTGPPVFGFRRANVTEERCQCDGAAACEFRLQVVDLGDSGHEVEFLKIRLAVAEERLSELETTVGDLVSAADLETVLGRITVAAARAVQAQGFILQLVDGQPGRHVYSHGLSTGEAERILLELEGADEGKRPDRLSARVTSQRRAYGNLVAVKPSAPFLPREAELLQTYAHFAAAVLDSATDLQRARENASRAEALLELASALAEISTSEEMAARLVRAVPTVIGCDRAAVALVQPGETTARFVSTLGLPDGAAERVARLELPPPPDLSGDILHFDPGDNSGMSFASEAFAITESAGAVMIPIIVEGAWVGYIAASVREEPARLVSAALELRLRGLAAQASAAIQNATLLDRIRHQAFHDSLTGLPNRALILDRLEQMLARAARSHQSIAVLFIDLDRFKIVNDTFGHAAGDLLIREAGSRLATAARYGDTVGRLGGDEFVVLIEGVSLGAGVEAVAERLMAVLHQPFDLAPHSQSPITVTTSIGIAAGHRPKAGDLLRDADIALYQAKDTGRARFVVFEPQMHQVIEEQLALRSELYGAIENNQFSLSYQPVFNLKSGEIIGAEALLRWRHPDRGELQPDSFIPLLEESGLIVTVGRWALIEACREAKSWNSHGPRFTVAINVSARQLDSPRFVGDMTGALEASGLDPSLVILEITETTIMRDTETSIQCLRTLKDIGVRISIDDFGTGYSSLAYLRQFPVDQLKIDKSFVSAINERVGGSTLIHALVQLGKTLNLETVAEGIERPIQHKALQDEECDCGQGFLFARPLDAVQIGGWFREASRPA